VLLVFVFLAAVEGRGEGGKRGVEGSLPRCRALCVRVSQQAPYCVGARFFFISPPFFSLAIVFSPRTSWEKQLMYKRACPDSKGTGRVEKGARGDGEGIGGFRCAGARWEKENLKGPSSGGERTKKTVTSGASWK